MDSCTIAIVDVASAIDASLPLAQLSILSSRFGDVPYAFWAAAAFALGALVGSFLNVVIHRWPLGESIVFPASRCGSCRVTIKPWDNIPIVSWLLLRGRCRACGAPFSSRYMLVELANALFYLALFGRMGVSPGFLLVAATISMTIVLIFIDLDSGYLPHVVTVPGIVVGLAVGYIGVGAQFPSLVLAAAWYESVIGAVAGFALIFSLSGLYKIIRGEWGMGGGDAFMLAMIGAAMGYQAVLPVLFLSSVVGTVIGVPAAMRSEKGMKAAIPYGVFLGLAVFVVLFFGATLAEWYLGVLVQ